MKHKLGGPAAIVLLGVVFAVVMAAAQQVSSRGPDGTQDQFLIVNILASVHDPNIFFRVQQNTLTTLRIDSATGLLSPASESQQLAVYGASIAVDPLNRFVFFMTSTAGGPPLTNAPCTPPDKWPSKEPDLLHFNYGQDCIYTFALDAASGALPLLRTPVRFLNRTPGPMVITPDGRFAYDWQLVYTGFTGHNFLAAYRIDDAGVLHELPLAGTQPPDRYFFGVMAMHPSGRFLVLSFQRLDGHVGLLTYTLDSFTGIAELTNITTAITPPNELLHWWLGSLALSPDGRFLFASEFGECGGCGGTVAVFRTMPDGSFQEIPEAEYSEKFSLGSIVIDPTGRYLHVLNTQSGSVLTLAIDPASGALSFVQELSVTGDLSTTDDFVIQLVRDRTGRFVYVAGFHSVHVLAMHSTTGVLTEIQTITLPSGGQVRAFAITP